MYTSKTRTKVKVAKSAQTAFTLAKTQISNANHCFRHQLYECSQTLALPGALSLVMMGTYSHYQ
jgi:hypothetical protein